MVSKTRSHAWFKDSIDTIVSAGARWVRTRWKPPSEPRVLPPTPGEGLFSLELFLFGLFYLLWLVLFVFSFLALPFALVLSLFPLGFAIFSPKHTEASGKLRALAKSISKRGANKLLRFQKA